MGEEPGCSLDVALISVAELRTHVRFLGDGQPPVHEQKNREHQQGQQRRPLQQNPASSN